MLSNRTKNLALAVLAVVTLAMLAYTLVRKPGANATSLPQPAATASTAPRKAGVFFGDSYFNGADGVPADQSMAALAAARLGFAAYIGGHGGVGFAATDKSSGTPNLATLTRQGHLADLVSTPAGVSLVVVEGGLNDGDEPASAVRAGVDTVLTAAKRTFPNAKVFLLGPVHPSGGANAALDRVEQVERTQAQAAGVPFISAASWVTAANRSQIIDAQGVHPSAAGHRLLAGMLVAALHSRGV